MPSISEVMTLCDFSSRSSAFYFVNKLVKEGILKKDKSGNLTPAEKLYELKLLGRIRAGFATPPEEDVADTITVGEYLIGDRNSSFLLQVDGDSMIDAGIQEGDMVIFERGKEPKVGDIVVALTSDGYTLKYLRRHAKGFYLEAANSAYPPIVPKEGQVIGVVTSSFRSYK